MHQIQLNFLSDPIIQIAKINNSLRRRARTSKVSRRTCSRSTLCIPIQKGIWRVCGADYRAKVSRFVCYTDPRSTNRPKRVVFFVAHDQTPPWRVHHARLNVPSLLSPIRSVNNPPRCGSILNIFLPLLFSRRKSPGWRARARKISFRLSR